MNRGDKSQLISVHHHHHLPVPHPAPFCGWITSKKAHGSERCDIGPTFLLLFGTDDSIQNPQVAGAMMRNRGTLPHIWYVFSLIPLHSSFLPPHRPQRGKCWYADHLQTQPCPCQHQHKHEHESDATMTMPVPDATGRAKRGKLPKRMAASPFLELICTPGNGRDPTAVLILVLPTLLPARCTQDKDSGIPPLSSYPACLNYDPEPHHFFQCCSLPLLIYVVSLSM